MLVRRAYVPEALRPTAAAAWPFTVPCVRELVADGLAFTAPVTFLVGENGSGKSTVIEAVAEAFKLDAQGGRSGRKYGNDRAKTPLGEILALETTAAGARLRSGPRSRRKGFFLRAETAFGLMNTVSGMHGYWDADTSSLSHGEGFLTVFAEMFREPGLYLMDEPEAALSFTSCLQLVALMRELGESGAQVVCATHSPILAATPGADIIEIGDHGTRRAKWAELDLTSQWRRFLHDPTFYLRHLTE
ncbi:ATP-binding cassette domain-containing protein [Amycolatopsis acidicola]|uniref:ATP-binding cassette domain-containing protein n=1 Tax=Amycolatopsis acidicola TaxID=2596893 RepID=A0A5N0V305_9PSEU|nr:ATP-binding cassette domain-containing protein [Amycolatopsis acidicola]KAA9157941.1 ATP-binding cassette domain-containing protein [Amycolatopsis acidicola]